MADIAFFLKLRIFKFNLIIFIIFSITITIICQEIPNRHFYYKKWMFRERRWENGGHIYEHLFGVKRWKAKLPDISDFIRWRFNKKHLTEIGTHYISEFLRESCKSEFTHWMIIFSTLTFNLWSDFFSTLPIFIFASILNLPYIIIQRYNRPRLIRLLKRNNLSEFQLSAAKI